MALFDVQEVGFSWFVGKQHLWVLQVGKGHNKGFVSLNFVFTSLVNM